MRRILAFVFACALLAVPAAQAGWSWGNGEGMSDGHLGLGPTRLATTLTPALFGYVYINGTPATGSTVTLKRISNGQTWTRTTIGTASSYLWSGNPPNAGVSYTLKANHVYGTCNWYSNTSTLNIPNPAPDGIQVNLDIGQNHTCTQAPVG